MKKQELPRLNLKRETIRQLEQPTLLVVVGAGPVESTYSKNC